MCVVFCVLVSGKILYCILCIYMIFHWYVHCPNLLFHFTVIGRNCTIMSGEKYEKAVKRKG